MVGFAGGAGLVGRLGEGGCDWMMREGGRWLVGWLAASCWDWLTGMDGIGGGNSNVG